MHVLQPRAACAPLPAVWARDRLHELSTVTLRGAGCGGVALVKKTGARGPAQMIKKFGLAPRQCVTSQHTDVHVHKCHATVQTCNCVPMRLYHAEVGNKGACMFTVLTRARAQRHARESGEQAGSHPTLLLP